MKNWQRAFILILGLGALTYAIDQIFEFITKWILPIIVNIQTVLYTLPSWIVSIISLIPFSYLPLILLYTIITVFLVQRAQNKIKAVERKANQVPELEKEIAEWAGICDGLKYHLTPEVEKWEMKKRLVVWDR